MIEILLLASRWLVGTRVCQAELGGEGAGQWQYATQRCEGLPIVTGMGHSMYFGEMEKIYLVCFFMVTDVDRIL